MVGWNEKKKSLSSLRSTVDAKQRKKKEENDHHLVTWGTSTTNKHFIKDFTTECHI